MSQSVKKTANNKCRSTIREESTSDHHLSEFHDPVHMMSDEMPDFLELEHFISNTYKRGQEFENVMGDDTSSNDDDYKIVIHKKDKLPKIKGHK